MHARFWLAALVGCPALGLLAGFAVSGLDSEPLLWAVLLGVPPAGTLLAGRALGKRAREVVAGVVLSVVATLVALFVILALVFLTGDFS